MDEATKNQKGSPSRDIFKRKHKDISKRLWGFDLDFAIVEKLPFPDIIAAFDYKQDGDDISFSENIGYCALIRRGIAVYIIVGDPEAGAFSISRFMGGNYVKPTNILREIHKTQNWNEFEKWETSLRDKWKSTFSDPEYRY